MASGLVDAYCLNTTPGANSPFAPPLGWEGNEESYMQLMRWRLVNDLQARQQIHSVARRKSVDARRTSLTARGPFGRTAKKILEAVMADRARAALEEAAITEKAS